MRATRKRFKNLIEYTCRFCGTTQYLNYSKNRESCGSEECVKDRSKEKKLLNKVKREKELKKRKAIKPKILEIKAIEVVGDYDYLNINAYKIKDKISEIKGYDTIQFFGAKYYIDFNEVPNKDYKKNGYILTEKTDGTYLVFMDYQIRCCPSSMAIKRAIIK